MGNANKNSRCQTGQQEFTSFVCYLTGGLKPPKSLDNRISQVNLVGAIPIFRMSVTGLKVLLAFQGLPSFFHHCSIVLRSRSDIGFWCSRHAPDMVGSWCRYPGFSPHLPMNLLLFKFIFRHINPGWMTNGDNTEWIYRRRQFYQSPDMILAVGIGIQC